MYIRFESENPIDCRAFYRSVTQIIRKRPKILFERSGLQTSSCYRGYIAISDTELVLIKNSGLVTCELEFSQISKKMFEAIEKRMPRRVFFNGFTERTNYSKFISYLSSFGTVSKVSMSKFSRTHRASGNQGYVDFLSPHAVENLMDQGEKQYIQRTALHFRLDLSDLVADPQGTSGISPQHLSSKSSRPVGKGRYPSFMPNLDFTGHQEKSGGTNAFGGYFIRPYLRYAEVVAENSNLASNVRLNILKPRDKASLNENKVPRWSPLPVEIAQASSL